MASLESDNPAARVDCIAEKGYQIFESCNRPPIVSLRVYELDSTIEGLGFTTRGVADAGQPEGQHVDSATYAVAASQFFQLPSAGPGTRTCSKGFQVMPTCSLEAVHSLPMRHCLRPLLLRHYRRVFRTSPWPEFVMR